MQPYEAFVQYCIAQYRQAKNHYGKKEYIKAFLLYKEISQEISKHPEQIRTKQMLLKNIRITASKLGENCASSRDYRNAKKWFGIALSHSIDSRKQEIFRNKILHVERMLINTSSPQKNNSHAHYPYWSQTTSSKCNQKPPPPTHGSSHAPYNEDRDTTQGQKKY